MEPLDPIVSLSVAIAEAPGSYAFFLGSGVSRDAGVPTGSQVFHQAVGELYRLEKETSDTPDEDALMDWLSETGRSDLKYADLLELIAPDAATRRDYLAKHFEGREPGSSHDGLALLAEQGFIKVFVTTNFDRLLEHALQARGIEPVVVTSASELQAAPRREHAQCYVLKPHGDYLQETIRNTPSEVRKLAPAISKELKEIFGRYGLVVLGYSGSDEAISQLLKARRSRYGLYWVGRSGPTEDALRVIEAVEGRVIERESAQVFLADLKRRLEVFRTHPSGYTPIEVHDEVLSLIRAGDRVGLSEVMRRERREFSGELLSTIQENRKKRHEDALLLEVHDRLLPLLERRLASLLPLVAYAPDAFEDEVRALCDLVESVPLEGGPTAWPELADWATWWLGYAAGAFALSLMSWEPVKSLLAASFTTRNDRRRFLVEPVRESVGVDIGKLVMARFSDSKWLVSRWEHLVWSLRESYVLVERWPEFLQGEKPPREMLNDFDLIVSIRHGLLGDEPLAHWGMDYDGGVRAARRIRNDARYRAAISECLDRDPEQFIEEAGAALKQARAPQWNESRAIEALLGT